MEVVSCGFSSHTQHILALARLRVNNCVGECNQKYFIQFTVRQWLNPGSGNCNFCNLLVMQGFSDMHAVSVVNIASALSHWLYQDVHACQFAREIGCRSAHVVRVVVVLAAAVPAFPAGGEAIIPAHLLVIAER